MVIPAYTAVEIDLNWDWSSDGIERAIIERIYWVIWKRMNVGHFVYVVFYNCTIKADLHSDRFIRQPKRPIVFFFVREKANRI